MDAALPLAPVRKGEPVVDNGQVGARRDHKYDIGFHRHAVFHPDDLHTGFLFQ